VERYHRVTVVLDSSQEPVDCTLLFDPFGVSHYLRLCEAIEEFTAWAVTSDPGIFRVRGANLRHAVERHLFFTVVADASSYRHFVAAERDGRIDDETSLSSMARLVAPFIVPATPTIDTRRKTLGQRFLRFVYRHFGQACSMAEVPEGNDPKVLFVTIHPKFVRYLRPIADALSCSTAFLTIDDPLTFQWLESEGLPRVRIDLTAESVELTKPAVPVGRYTYNAGPFDYFAVRFNAIRRALKKVRPECIIIPEGNAPINELVNRVARTLAIPTVCIQQGWAPVVHPGFRNMSFTRMCVWGEGFREILAKYNPNQRFMVTGNHMVTRAQQIEDLKRCAVAFFLQKGHHLMTPLAWREMLALISWTAKAFPESDILVREHPSAPLNAAEGAGIECFRNVQMVPAEQVTLDAVLCRCAVAVAMDSTTILESTAAGVVPLILNVNGFAHYNPNIAADGAAIEVDNFHDARLAIRRLIEDDGYRRSFGAAIQQVSERFFARDREASVSAIVTEIERLRHKSVFSMTAATLARFIP
jgi:hypothetical protein